MTAIGYDTLTRSSIPDLHSCIETARHQVFAIRGPGNSENITLMTTISINVSAPMSIPDLHGAIATGGGNPLAIGRPGYTTHVARMTLVGIMSWWSQEVLHKANGSRKVNIGS